MSFMAMNPLPPQAYTKDTLLRAYAWLQNQNPSIRAMATTPDILVSLYLKTTRDGDASLDRPSIQNFKNELKSLAGLMGELEISQKIETQKAIPSQRPPPITPMAYSTDEKPFLASSKISEPLGTGSLATLNSENLDTLSIEMLEEIKNGFNLSDQKEALRLVIKLGYLKAKKILTE